MRKQWEKTPIGLNPLIELSNGISSWYISNAIVYLLSQYVVGPFRYFLKCSKIDNFQPIEMKPWRGTTSDLGLYVYKALAQLLHTTLACTKYLISSGTDGRTDRQTDGQAQPYIPSFLRGIITKTKTSKLLSSQIIAIIVRWKLHKWYIGLGQPCLYLNSILIYFVNIPVLTQRLSK